MSNINIPVLLQTLGYIEENPHTWNQSAWRALPLDAENKATIQESTRCGANLCFAGHAAMLTGAKWVLPKKDLVQVLKDKPDEVHKHNMTILLSLVKPDKEIKTLIDKQEDDEEDVYGTEEYVEVQAAENPLTGQLVSAIDAGEWAKRKLGLSSDEAAKLFAAENTINDLRSIVLTLVHDQMVEDGTWNPDGSGEDW